MRFLHLADLHLGKRLNGVSFIEDQEYILRQLLEMVKEYCPDALLIAGDVYDKSTPSVEAVALFDEFLTELSRLRLPVLVISGNHDSPERMDFGSRIMEHQDIYVAGAFDGKVKEVILHDDAGPVSFRLLPFIRPAQVRRYYPDEELATYDEAFNRVLRDFPVASGCRCVLLAHQFITNHGESPERSESEQLNVGGLDNIDAAAFAGYAYVALGHIHRPQTAGGEHIRYAGSPLKYSFSEANHEKSVPLVELDAAGKARIKLLPLTPRRDMRRIKGRLEQLLRPEVYNEGDRTDYLQVTLTDEEDLVAPMDALRSVYPNVLRLELANSRSGIGEDTETAAEEEKSPAELFRAFYALQQNEEPDEAKMAVVGKIFRRLEENDR